MGRCVGITAAVCMAAALGAPWAVAATEVTLNECVGRALAASPDLAAAIHRVTAARAGIRAAEAAFHPGVRLGHTWSRTDNPPAAFMSVLNQRQLSLETDFNNPDEVENANFRIGAEWRLFDGGRRVSGRRAAIAGEDGSRAQLDAVRNELVYQVHRAFYGVLQAAELVHIQGAAIESIEAALRIARERFDAGAVVKTDVLNLEVRLAEARERLARARNRLALARSALVNAVGDPDLEAAEPVGRPAEEGAPVPDLDSLTVYGRPELRATEAGVRATRMTVQRLEREYWPDVDAIAHYDWDGEPYTDFQESWFAGVTARWDAWDGTGRKNRIEEAEARLAAAEQDARRVELDLQHQLNQAVSAWREAVERVDVTRKSAELAEESYRMTQERYQNGTVDITELLGTESAMTSARSLATTAIHDREIARAGLERAVGRFAEETPGMPGEPGGDR